MPRTFHRSNGGYILLSDAALSLIRKYTQSSNKPESGGILLGIYRGFHIEVTEVTPPGPNDLHSKYSFHRKCHTHQSIARTKWKQTHHIVTYIGEWHTHPQDAPSPSTTDYREWEAGLPPRDMVVCIQGLESLWVGEFESKIRTVHSLTETI